MTDIVKFNLPDGSEISNDRRWLAEQDKDLRSILLAASENTGNVGIDDDEMKAQIGGGLAPGQSGQEGVGESPTASPEEMVAGKFTGAVAQVSDAEKARAQGATPDSPAVEAPEVSDSNKAVLAQREKKAKAAQKAAEAAADLGEEGAGDPEKPYTEWSAKQLKAEVLSRNADRDEAHQVVTKGVKNKADLAALLDADDAAQAAQA